MIKSKYLSSFALTAPLMFGACVASLDESGQDVRATQQKLSSTISAQVATGLHDAEERADGTMYLNSSDLELSDDGSDSQIVGMRFTDLDIPVGATITNAYLEFTVDEASTGTTNLTIHAEDLAGPSNFSSSRYDLSRRARTSASVSWTPQPWQQSDVGTQKQSPDISSLLQEVVDGGIWQPGLDMVLLIRGSGRRTAEAYENGVSSKAARLVVDYDTSSGGPSIPDGPTRYLEAECPDSSSGAYATVYADEERYEEMGHLLSVHNTYSSSNGQDNASYSFTTDAGFHKLHFRVHTNGSGDDDSWYYRVDGGSWIDMNNYSNLGDDWGWASGSQRYLSSGSHTLDVRNREDGLRMDRIAILPAAETLPTNNNGGRAYNCVEEAPEISCGDKTCIGGESCRDPQTTAQDTSCEYITGFFGEGQPVMCDSQEDCGEGSTCVYELLGNIGQVIRCRTAEELIEYENFYMRQLCASPGGTSECPSGQVCGPANSIGYAHCQEESEILDGISCGDNTCTGSDICCVGSTLEEPICTTQNCYSGGTFGFTSPRFCDSPDDCGTGTSCAFALQGNAGAGFTCVSDSSIENSSTGLPAQLCGSPSWTLSAPCLRPGSVCGEPDDLGYRYCSFGN